MNKTRQPAVLIIGQTGSGKTPLGLALEKNGLGGKSCLHFDFGAELRRCACRPNILEPAEMHVVEHSLATGSLLEDTDFGIALKLFKAFLKERRAGKNVLVALNGLPRHIGQAVALEPYADIRLVVNLDCCPETALERIQLNAVGDRAGRADDNPEGITKRATLFKERTEPLLGYYKRLGVPVINAPIGVETSAEDTYKQIAGGCLCGLNVSQVDL